MQRIISAVRTLTSIGSLQCRHLNIQQLFFSTLQRKTTDRNLLAAFTPVFNPVCSFKVKGRVRRRCKSCYIVVRDERFYNICPKYGRHKQMSMKPKPLTTYVLTHASQSPVRPW